TIAAKMKKMDSDIAEYVKSKHTQKNTQQGEAWVTIPVVVHIVYKNSSENVSDLVVGGVMRRLNYDFRKNNSDTTFIRNTFKPFAADAHVEFCLATRDPDGNSTSGVTRTSTTVQEFTTNDAVKFDSQGGKDAWPRNQYMNVWVCDLDPGLGGYAQFPGQSSLTDGIVIDYAAFTFSSRTTTHEVGHWLALYHTFQGGCTGISSADCLTGGDQVCDTPQQMDPAFGCTTSDNTCSESPTDYPDMIENFMSYNSCQYMFTQGQVDRMEVIINGARNSLKSSFGCCTASKTSIISYPEVEDVEDSLFPPTGWTIWNPNVNVTWSRTDLVSGYNFSKASAKLYFFSPGEDIDGESDHFISPKYVLTNVTAPLTLNFNVAYARYSDQKYDSLIIHVTDNQCEGAWTRIWAEGNLDLATAEDHMDEFIPTKYEWKSVSISLDNYVGDTALHVIFEGKSGWGNNLYIDDINVNPYPLAIKEVEKEKGVVLYPNPTANAFWLAFDNVVEQELEIFVLNVLGEVVLSKRISAGSTSDNIKIDLEQFDQGVYFVQVKEGMRSIFNEKIILGY
ncbi:T9SS type A sorting domain-containing protein, partial [Candidatus Amoebophilus asiaticus]|nr:T9SS type A sorting domain-containing protein [Candidatus Amoebophilus asiaticus]